MNKNEFNKNNIFNVNEEMNLMDERCCFLDVDGISKYLSNKKKNIAPDR